MTATAPELDGIVGWVVDLMEALGAPGVGLAIALENLFPPLPSEVFLPLAGFAAARGDLSLVAAIVWTTIGSVVGALALYGLGAALGRDRLRAIVDRMPLVDLADLDKGEAWFARHGPKAVFFGRMVPIVRSMISVPAGVERMSIVLFLVLTTAGSLIWNSVFVLAGYFLGENWHIVEGYAGILSKAVLAAAVIAVVVFVARRIARRRRAVPVDDAPTERIPVVPTQAPQPRPGAGDVTERMPAVPRDAPPPPR
ncbi:DedA family protein [Pseudonocardia sichuanensis]|uniref:Membrane protein DedA with SNARE-associated domain n=1 Tax=Pseudonocardia kunmingensis TaxID=630975 RepID=A0A543DJ98_9PSEU|nr:DedA family protein [Pseudonocardia kunmingensis]TQM09416.1 membrane protein DedA with SNARE-associated domain [Pseudonocardia kunmingensis]